MERHVPNNMDQLAFKYMMCKVSSSDSDSEISPRLSDTSTMGCVSSTPESLTFRRTLPITQKPAGRYGCCSLFSDPYDGSSEDSDEPNNNGGVSSRRFKQQGKGGGGGSRFSGRSRRDGDGGRALSEKMAEDSTMQSQTMDVALHCQLDDSGFHATRYSTPHTPAPVTPAEVSLSQATDLSSESSPCPCNLRSLYKRKLGFPGAEVVELGQRKRQCVVDMEDQQEERDSASETCSSHLTMD
ncbi:hypothetical protein CesoFtcFv8_017500 [Champsocephalus esox]|uniref:Uncharacterized protein n=1 Tax=Champsocephalus esox TaxID=159716 RepID=A0AAN8BKF9_9TELE|nr:hypothetical protein CesoFtcFv8_017500 [Champsocephalus esox]